MEVNGARLAASAYVRPAQGEPMSGDAAVVRELPRGLFLAIVDVLGHGHEASELALEIAAFLESAEGDPVTVIRNLHTHIKGSRGAAVGLCHVDEVTGDVNYVGYGNTALRRLWREPAQLFSRDGTIGRHVGRPWPQRLTLKSGDLLVLYTDGVRSHFELEQYPEAIRDDAATVARNIVEYFGKDLDDAGCIAVTYRDSES